MNAALDRVSFMYAVFTGLSKLIKADTYTVQLLDLTKSLMLSKIFPSDPYTQAEAEYTRVHSELNPLVAHYRRTGDTCARRITDVMTRKEWLKTSFFQNSLKRLGYVNVVALPISVDSTLVAGLAIWRRRPNFTLQQCSLLDTFAPHFRQASLRHVESWSEKPIAPRRRAPVELGLTGRQIQVLFWMTEGKQNREISLILNIRLGTVQDHVAEILRKLCVENRHAATVFALRELDLA